MIVDDIRNIVESLGVPFIYDTPYRVNILLDRAPNEVGVLYLIDGREINVKNGTSRKTADINLFFLRRVKLDANGYEVETAITDMMKCAVQFYAEADAIHTFRIKDDKIDIKSVFPAKDSYFAGISMQFNAEELRHECITTMPAPVIYFEDGSVNMDAVDGASIYYTIDGTTPTKDSLLYSVPLSVESGTTVKAIAVKKFEGTSKAAEYYHD